MSQRNNCLTPRPLCIVSLLAIAETSLICSKSSHTLSETCIGLCHQVTISPQLCLTSQILTIDLQLCFLPPSSPPFLCTLRLISSIAALLALLASKLSSVKDHHLITRAHLTVLWSVRTRMRKMEFVLTTVFVKGVPLRFGFLKTAESITEGDGLMPQTDPG